MFSKYLLVLLFVFSMSPLQPAHTDNLDACVKSSQIKKWCVSYGGISSWIELRKSNAHATKIKLGDFNGDGKSDVFGTWDGKWHVSYGGTSDWGVLKTSNANTSKIQIGDFNGDGKSDVFATWDGKWQVSYAGVSVWKELRKSNAHATKVKLGDFDGDGKSDVFATWGGKWHVSYGGTSDWEVLNTSKADTSKVQVGDFNGDGKSDIFATWDGKWHVSYGGVSAWQELRKSNAHATKVRLGDFNGDGKSDIVATWDGKWHVSYGGTSDWKELNFHKAHTSKIQVGDFNGDGKSDIFASSISTYAEECKVSEVPIPPAFGETGWQYIGNLKEQDILSDPDFNPLYLWKYVSNNPEGLCAATVRYKKGTTQEIPTSKENVEVIGIICQGTQTGNACFWHSEQSGKQFGVNVTDMVDANHIKTTTPPDNKPLKCTFCHLGKNAFIVHPETVLTEFSVIPKMRYMPVSNKFNATSNEGNFWSNPKSKLNLSKEQCGACHNFGQINSVWCDEVFYKVLGKTMPPSRNQADYKEDIDKIKNACRNAR